MIYKNLCVFATCAPLRYTQVNSKIRNMARRRPEFEPGKAGAEAAKLKKFSDAGGSQIQWLSDAVRNQFLSLLEYITKFGVKDDVWSNLETGYF
jgi:hypothetical protein